MAQAYAPRLISRGSAIKSQAMPSKNGSDDQKIREFEEQAMPLMPLLLAMARRSTKTEEDAQDLVQDTYMKAFKSWQQFEQGTNLKAWMVRIMHNTNMNNVEKAKKDKSSGSIDALEDWQVGAAESLTSRASRSAEAEALDNMPTETILKALDSLPAEFREVLLQAVVVGLSYKEIAANMGDNPITVGTRLTRAKKALRVALADYAREEGYLVQEDEN